MSANNTTTAQEPAAAMVTDATSANVIESLLPLLGLRGFAPLYSLIGSSLGIDPTYLLTTIGLAWAFNRLFRQIYYYLYGVVTEYMMSSIHISSTDDIYLHLMKWLASQPRMLNSRSLNAETVSRTAWEDEDESTVARDRSGKYLNFSNQESRSPPQFVPALGLHNFWWKGQYFRLHRKQQAMFDEGDGYGATFKDKEYLVISCLGRSPLPIKDLLSYAKEHYYMDHQARTIVKRPGPINIRRYGGRHSWQQVANRPVRDMRTVVLDQEQKLAVLADMNEYLHPSTPRWYANRGIPLRRGYLFYGPPGTGKTSLSFALAGVFGLEIYVISLQEPTLTEEDLGALFGALPRRCVVLLEDIDSAGLRRPPDQIEKDEKAEAAAASKSSNSGDNKEGKESDNKEGKESDNKVSGGDGGNSKDSANDWKVSDLAKALKKEGSKSDEKGISLSGLLNAIDGVASHEGRVLIMTTNAPESLDEALIRPGRVDLHVGFTNATTVQAEELFIRMYETEEKLGVAAKRGANGAITGPQTDLNGSASITAMAAATAATIMGASNGTASTEKQQQVEEQNAHVPSPVVEPLDVPKEELPSVARQFAQKIPDSQFSPAEIQGYLLKRKKHPLRALREVEEWVSALERQKASRSKISKVQ